MHYKEQNQAWFLDAVEIYCDEINMFADHLDKVALDSRGFLGFREFLIKYAALIKS